MEGQYTLHKLIKELCNTTHYCKWQLSDLPVFASTADVSFEIENTSAP